MPRLMLLRHGATLRPGSYCGSTDVPVSEPGLAAMHAAVAGRAWQQIISSPLQRCAQFARTLATQLGVPYREEARIRELHFGAWEGRTVEDLHTSQPEALGAFWRDPVHAAPAGAEPLQELQARVFAFRDELLATQDSLDAADVLIVTHGGPIRLLLAAERGLSLREALALDVPLAALVELTTNASTSSQSATP